jgi:hypothetical protein
MNLVITLSQFSKKAANRKLAASRKLASIEPQVEKFWFHNFVER